MRQVFEFSGFLAGAAALHLAVGLIAVDGAPDAGGVNGDAPVTLAAATPSMQALVAEWDRPVVAARTVVQPQTQPPDMDASSATPAAPAPPGPDGALRRPPALSAPVLGAAPSVPQIDRQTAAPPQPPQRPKARPPAPAKAAKAAKAEPRPKPAKPKPAAPAASGKSATASALQKAAGTAGQTNRGTAGAAQSSAAQKGNQQQLLAKWGGQIRNSIERRKRYPAGIRATGTVTLAISVHTRGALAGVSVRRSSGVAQIDNAAVTAVRKARIAAAPKGLAAGVHSFTLPMKFAP